MTKEEILQKKIGFISLGCDKNRVDLEKMIFNIKSAGFEVVNDPEKANIILVNTCSFLESSRLESVENIIEMGNYKSKNLEKLIVTGCLNELKISDLDTSLPEVDAFVNVKDNEKIVSTIFNLYNLNYSVDVKSGRILTTPSHYAYIKISEGCNNFCSYCLIPYIRGRYVSRPIEDILSEAKSLASNGVKELILVAQDVTKYGVDIYNKKSLVELLNKISKIDGIEWIRLLYCYPEEIDDNLISEIKNNSKIVKYLDIPLQHVSNKILKSMNRKSTKENIEKLFTKLKTEIPSISLRTTFILGYPDESSEDFEEIIDFIKKYKINNVGFFKYSREEGTRAYNFENQIDEEIKQERLDIISQVQYDIQNKILDNYIGKVLDVIIDESNADYSVGRYYGQAPLIDGVVIINEKLTVGEFYKIKIIDKSEYDLIGEKLWISQIEYH